MCSIRDEVHITKGNCIMTDTIINVSSLSFGYAGSDVLVLEDITFDIKKGEIALIIGASGSGKTTLLKMLDKYALPEAGEIFFAASDLARMSNDFRAEVEKSAASKGGSLVISEEGRKIENGFVLAYGGIEENCTLQAIFDAKKDELSDKVHRIIFA